MGFFSWMFADTDNEEALKAGKEAYVPMPEGFGNQLFEWNYRGYGCFQGEDIFDLVADWNRNYLALHPEYEIPSFKRFEKRVSKVSEMEWYPFYADLSLTRDEVVEKWKKATGRKYPEYREIGIVLATYDDDNASLPYPIKVCKYKESRYETVPASKKDPNQGCY